MELTPIIDNQRRIFIDTVQLYSAFREITQKSRAYQGGMHWKPSKGHQYLFRTRDRSGYGKSLGPRSPETEKILGEFEKAKKETQERLSHFKERIQEQARFCMADFAEPDKDFVESYMEQARKFVEAIKNT